jgi:1-phosphatidylinositol-4-phosphate 5-kinase
MMGKDSSMMKAWEATVKKTQAVAKKRANSIFGSTYVAASQGDENENKDETEVYHAERVLPNGD